MTYKNIYINNILIQIILINIVPVAAKAKDKIKYFS